MQTSFQNCGEGIKIFTPVSEEEGKKTLIFRRGDMEFGVRDGKLHNAV